MRRRVFVETMTRTEACEALDVTYQDVAELIRRLHLVPAKTGRVTRKSVMDTRRLIEQGFLVPPRATTTTETTR